MNDFDAILNEAITALPPPTADPLDPTTAVETAAPEGQAPAPSAETPATDPAAPAADPEKPAETPPEAPAEPATPAPVAAEGSLARRLALIAQAEQRSKREAAARAAEEAKTKPDLEKLAKARAATTRLEAAKTALDLDEDALAELYLEAHQHFAGENGEAPKVVPGKAPDVAELVKKAVEQTLAEREKAREAAEAAAEDAGRAIVVRETYAVLAAKVEDFPHCATSFPDAKSIAFVTEDIARRERRMPAPEEVLAVIETHRRSEYDKVLARRKKPSESAPAKTAPVPTGEPSGKQPIRSNDAPVITSTKKRSHEEILDAEIAALGLS